MKRRVISIATALSLILAAFSFIVSADGETLTLDKTEYTVGSTIEVTFSGCTSAKDWVGIYEKSKSVPSAGNGSLNWAYVSSGTQTAGDLKSSGTISIKLTGKSGNLPAGDYCAILLPNDSYSPIMKSADFKIVSSGALSAPKKVEYKRISNIPGCVEGIVTVTPADDAPDGCTYRLYWADASGNKLEDYSMIAEVEGKYVFNEGQFVPAGASKIIAYAANGEDTSAAAAAYTFDGDELVPNANLKYSFNVFSDIHTATANFDKALRDIIANMSGSSAILTCGDNTNNGSESDWSAVGNIYTQVNGELGLPPFYLALGNHDSRIYRGNIEAVYANIRNAVGGEKLKSLTQYTKAYYDFRIDGTEVIILAGEEAEKDTSPNGYADLSPEQLSWLSEKLDENTDGPVFVIVHQPLYHTISGTLEDFPVDGAGNYENDGSNIQDWYGVIQDAELRSILDAHPNVILFTGHGHWDLNETQPSLITNYKNTATYINCPSLSDLWTDTDSGRKGSQGLYVEVYDKYVLIRGRDYYNSQWIGCAQFIISRDLSFNPPTVADGHNGLYKKTTSEGLSFTTSSHRSLTDIMVDNEIIPADNYTLSDSENGTTVTLKASYLDTLSGNFHKIAFISEDGTARADFEVRDKAAITEGDGSTWAQSSNSALTFKTNIRSRVFDSTGVTVDDIPLTEDDFTYDDRGITVDISLGGDYLDTLSLGSHTIKVLSDNGTASAAFTIEAASPTSSTGSGTTTATTATTATAATTATTAKGTTTTATTSAAAAVTGDSIALALLLAIASVGALGLIFIAKKKKI
ncbi:MAG: metallophosphoesterase [Firmicutes bacterium]|nr:metallophosphoesterase [Bacillota bacterium]